MAHFIKVGPKEHFVQQQMNVVELEGYTILIFCIDNNFYAVDNTCPHRGASLAKGTVTGDAIRCPWHGARFNIKTGKVLSPPATQGIISFPTRTVDNQLEIDIEQLHQKNS